MTGPIKPEKVEQANIPEEVFEIFNALITEKWNGSSAKVIQDEVVRRVVKALGGTRQQVFDKGYINVEFAYRQVGWKVKYDKPSYDDSYEAFWIFSK